MEKVNTFINAVSGVKRCEGMLVVLARPMGHTPLYADVWATIFGVDIEHID